MMEYLKKQEITGKKILFLHTGGRLYFLIFWRMRNKNEKTDDSWSKLFADTSL